MTEAKRRINKFKFDTEDAHVALVDKAANAQEVLVMKAAKDEQELEKNSQPSVDSQGEDVVKTEGETITKSEEEDTKMTEETKVTDASVQEMIKKALGEQRKEVEEELRKSLAEEFEAKDKERDAELQILKADREVREEKAFIAKAAEYKEHVVTGDTEQHEAVSALAKALRKADADEDMKPLVELAKSLKETVEKSALLDEMGGTSVQKADEKYSTEGDKLVMKMVKEEGVKEADAYAKLMTERPELFQ